MAALTPTAGMGAYVLFMILAFSTSAVAVALGSWGLEILQLLSPVSCWIHRRIGGPAGPVAKGGKGGRQR